MQKDLCVLNCTELHAIVKCAVPDICLGAGEPSDDPYSHMTMTSRGHLIHASRAGRSPCECKGLLGHAHGNNRQ